MDKRFLIILGVVIAALIGIFVLTGDNDPSSGAKFQGNAAEVQADDWVAGPAEAPVTLIEFADFQCPGCAALYPALEQVKSELGDNIRFVYRHFPLTTIHQNAMAAHRSAEAAGKQGKFWDMYHLLFQRQQQWSAANNAQSVFEGYAQELGLNMDQYATDLASSAVADKIAKDRDSGGQLNISSTPTLVLNGQVIETPRTANELRQVLQDAIDAAKGSARG